MQKRKKKKKKEKEKKRKGSFCLAGRSGVELT